MTKFDVAQYRTDFWNCEGLPCLKCTDEKIMACSRANGPNAGCIDFKRYVLHPERSATIYVHKKTLTKK